jgi:hypothetical protein
MHARHPDIARRWDAEIRRKKKKARAMSHNVLLCLSDGEVAKTKDPLTFWKEVARVGKFQKGDFKFSITEKSIDHWCKTHKVRSQRGIECPLPVEHTKDPEKRRGTVLELAKGANSKGETAMFAKIKFRDSEAAKLRTSGVSIFVPVEDSDGYGNKYVAPVQHIAITDYPVIAGLEPWQPIACSMNDWSLAFPPSSGGDKPPEEGKNASTTPSAGKSGQSPPSDPGKPPPGQPKPGDQGPAQQRVTLRGVADTLGIDPQITDEAQLLLAIQQTIMAMRSGQHMQQMPQPAVARPPMAPMAPAPGVAPMMPRPQPYQQRPPIAMSHSHNTKKQRKQRRAMMADVGFSLEDVPENILMSLSKKQMKKLVKTIKKGKGKRIKSDMEANDFNDESHFGQECIADSDEDDTYKDEDNDAFENGSENMEENDEMLSGKARSGPAGLALSGSQLEIVKENRQMKINALFAGGYLTPVAKKRLEERFVKGQGVAFSHQYDDGFKDLVEDLIANGRVLNVRSNTGVQVLPGGVVALSNGAEGTKSPLQADAERRSNGKPNHSPE